MDTQDEKRFEWNVLWWAEWRGKSRGLQRIYFLFILNTFIELVLKIGDETLLTVICQMMEYLNNSLSEDYLSGPGDSDDIPA